MMELTKEEQIQAIYDLKVGYTLGHADIAMLKAMARQLLAGLEQEPVAQVYQPANIGICAPLGPSVMMLKPLSPGTKLYAAPQLPQPAVVPDEVIVFLNHLEDVLPDEAFNLIDVKTWNNVSMLSRPEVYRAAILQGAEPVSHGDELPMDYLQGHKDGLEWAARLAEANHPQTGDWLYDDPLELAKAIRKGPDMPTAPVQGWIPCSERMPEEIGRYWCYVEEQNSLGKSHYQWNCSWNGDRWWVESENGGRVTHWMPLQEPPKQTAES